MSDDKKNRESAMRHELGADEDHKRMLHEHYDGLEWEFQCWNCGKRIVRKLSDMKGPCPHCGVELSKKA